VYPVPAVSDLAAFSGRDEATYTAYANSALLQSTIRFTFLTEITDPKQFTGYNALTGADQTMLALQGICALADSIYLQFPYQQAQASPMNSETIGSYSYTKEATSGAGGAMYRMQAGAQELSMGTTGIPLFDTAVQLLSLRTIASGVFAEGMSVFEEGERRSALGSGLFIEDDNGRRWILGPEDHNLYNFPFDVNAQSFPSDPGI
jgi:hypothetical protein